MAAADPAIAAEQTLQELAAHPAAPFHEEGVAGVVKAHLARLGVPYHMDRYGNIIAHYVRGRAHRPVALVAHMDHPAFEVIAHDSGEHQALLLGGGTALVPYLTPNTALRVMSKAGVVPGRLVEATTDPATARTTLSIQAERALEPDDWGVWEMADFEVRGDYLHLRAVDDLGGCALTLSTLARLQEHGGPADFYGVFTRAEEVGLQGAALVARSRRIPKRTLIVSVEASRTLPGAVQGGGPVIRVGDFRSTFHAEAEAILHAGWARLRETDQGFKVQRQLMSGGTCEATMFSAFGYTTTGVALPLGNYHNMGDDGMLSLENIHRSDFAGAGALLLAAAEACAEPISNTLRERYGQVPANVRRRLERTASPPLPSD